MAKKTCRSFHELVATFFIFSYLFQFDTHYLIKLVTDASSNAIPEISSQKQGQKFKFQLWFSRKINTIQNTRQFMTLNFIPSLNSLIFCIINLNNIVMG